MNRRQMKINNNGGGGGGGGGGGDKRMQRSSTYLEVREFLNDIYQHLSHESTTPTNGDHLQLLINRCRHVLLIFEMVFDEPPATQSAADQPYLDMSLNKSGTSLPASSSISEYVDVSRPDDAPQTNQPQSSASVSDSIATPTPLSQYQPIVRNDLYEQCVYDPIGNAAATTTVSAATASTINTATSDQSISCPFSGMPAAHLRIKDATHTGYINKIERRLFFDNTKKFYAGIIDNWMLLYAGGDTDLKPTTCIPLARCTLHTRTNEQASETVVHAFQLLVQHQQPMVLQPPPPTPPSQQPLTVSGHSFSKKFHFTVTTKTEWIEWMAAIVPRTSSNTCERHGTSTIVGGGNRKLPTPPALLPSDANDTTAYAQRLSNDSEDIYEVPTAAMDHHHYHNPCDQLVAHVIRTNPIQNYDIPITPPKCIDNGQLCQHRTPATDTPTSMTADQHKFNNVKTMLYAQLRTTGPPKPMLPMQRSPPNHPNNANDTPTISTARRKPMRNWFSSRLTRSLAQAKDVAVVVVAERLVSGGGGGGGGGGATGNNECRAAALPLAGKSSGGGGGGGGAKETERTVKGGKINMIINQLEANGRLPMFGKSGPDARSDVAMDDHNYEPVSMIAKG